MTKAAADRKVQELGIFHDVAKALTSSLDLDSILQTIMEKMAEYFRPDNWSLLMVDEERDELYFAIAVGKASEALKNVRLKVGEGIAGWVAKHGERVVVPDVYTDPRFAKRIDEMTQWETRSIICVPLRSKLRVLGVIQLVNVRMEHFTDQESFFLQSICDYAAIAIENARAVEKIQELTITDDCTGLYNARHLYQDAGDRSLPLGAVRLRIHRGVHRSRPLQAGQRHLRTPGRKQAADGDWLPDQSAAAIDRLRLPLRWRRVCGAVAPDWKRRGPDRGQTPAR